MLVSAKLVSQTVRHGTVQNFQGCPCQVDLSEPSSRPTTSPKLQLLLDPRSRLAWLVEEISFFFFIVDEPSQSVKRPRDTILETSSLLAAKRARLFETNLQQPTPKRSRAPFLGGHVGPTDTISEWLESVGPERESQTVPVRQLPSPFERRRHLKGPHEISTTSNSAITCRILLIGGRISV